MGVNVAGIVTMMEPWVERVTFRFVVLQQDKDTRFRSTTLAIVSKNEYILPRVPTFSYHDLWLY